MKSGSFKHVLRPVVIVSLALLGATGCGLVEPGDYTLKTNEPPDTEITSGPKPGSTNSYFVTIAWKGIDLDGVVKGYTVSVDGRSLFTTKTDSTFRFTAANKDEPHTISVAARDNDGADDPTPATLTFTATNVAPNTIIQVVGNPAPGATFGQGAVFTAVAVDDPDNGPEYTYRYKIDAGGQWSQWQSSPVFEFSLTSPFGLLPEGEHTFYAQARDNALAVDESPAEFRFVASATVKPGVVLSALKNGAAFYPDSSAFSLATGNTVSFSWAPTFNYAGGASTGSRYRIDGGAWTEFSTEIATLELTNVTPGTHTFEVQYRDLAGKLSDIALYRYTIVVATLNAGVLVVDDGNGQLAGRPPATGDANVDNFYTQVLTAVGARLTLWDYLAQGAPTPKKGFGNYSSVIWQSDEATANNTPRQLQLLGDYLTVGGKLWLTGWRQINQIAGTTPVSNFNPAQANAPASYAFVWNYLGIASTRQTPGNFFDFNGATGQAGYPNFAVDLAKNPIPSRPGLSPIDVFTVREGAQGIYTFNSASGNQDWQGAIVGVKHVGTNFRTVVFGFPLYHLNASDAQAVVRQVMSDFGEI
ncbi:MAG: hypothetical protein ONB48_05165 [candidate division KSB1 bacterium]|nr:hypothetical protein [candidate division KSB1 bacterium]MDZ7276541.1 hypothetical protein [candidate division KSB1 bacterium]MDZ7285041.1 hypothetical protein [candidate division KSB1 bacterium]MDZ7298073.1 hypothetical protein [candidate division KSB1 bacterium]MDZ7307697.1 hypothetical protein [candidate division KSB1 bacterium]